jgi:hypothetical protein
MKFHLSIILSISIVSLLACSIPYMKCRLLYISGMCENGYCKSVITNYTDNTSEKRSHKIHMCKYQNEVPCAYVIKYCVNLIYSGYCNTEDGEIVCKGRNENGFIIINYNPNDCLDY